MRVKRLLQDDDYLQREIWSITEAIYQKVIWRTSKRPEQFSEIGPIKSPATNYSSKQTGYKIYEQKFKRHLPIRDEGLQHKKRAQIVGDIDQDIKSGLQQSINFWLHLRDWKSQKLVSENGYRYKKILWREA